MAYISKSMVTPLLLTCEDKSMYLHMDSQGCALFHEDNPEPLYRCQEPLLLAQGVMTAARTAHLVLLKANGDLCYTLITDLGIPQTSLLAKLDIRTTRYRRLFLFPKGKLVHIFYAYSNNAIPDLWRIEHRFWDGASWRSVHMGEVIHPREPLYHVSLDSQGNIHCLTMTFQGRQSLLFANRFNGTFHIWGSPTEALKIPGEVVDMTALMTTDNVHHLFWAVKTPGGQFELRWAQQTDALGLSSTWHPSPSPIKTFSAPWKKMGALERNGVLWLLAHTGEEALMLNDGKGWISVSSHASINRPIQWVHKGEKNFYQTYWSEDLSMRRAPGFYQELGFSVKKQAPTVSSMPVQAIPNQSIPPTPPPVPAYYPEPSANLDQTPPGIPENETDTLELLVLDTDETTGSPSAHLLPPMIEIPPEKVQKPQPLKEQPEFQSLLTTVAYLEHKNIELQTLIPTIARLEEENSKLQALSTTVKQLEQENSKLQDLILTVNKLENESSKLQSLAAKVSDLEKENSQLESLVSSMANLKEENSDLRTLITLRSEQGDPELHSLTATVAHLEEENAELRSFINSRLEQEDSELQNLTSTVTYLEQENNNLSLAIQDLLARYDQILDVISEKDQQTKQEMALLEELIAAQPVTAPLAELGPFQEAMSNLEQETQNLSQVLRVMLTKQEENDSSLEKLETQIGQLQDEKEAGKNKGGFWNKWIT